MSEPTQETSPTNGSSPGATPEVHSPLGASAAARFFICPGSVLLTQRLEAEGVVPEVSEYAEEGTAAHELAATCLVVSKRPLDFFGQIFGKHKVTREMIRAVNIYVDHVWSRIAEYQQPDYQMYVEVQFNMEDIHPGLFGTADCVLVFPQWHMLEIIDFKYGQGVAVNVKKNLQLQYYACGAIHTLEGVEEARDVRCTIIQPRCAHPEGPVREWDTTTEDLGDFLHRTLLTAVQRALTPGAPFYHGQHCQFCPAMGNCPHITHLQGKFVSMKTEPKLLPIEELSTLYGQTKVLKKNIEAVEREVFRRLQQGHNVTTAKLVEKEARRVFRAGAEDWFRVCFGNDAYDKKFKSPAQIEEISDEAAQMVKSWAYKPKTGLTVAPAWDKRVAMPAQKPEDVFAHVKTDET